MVHLGQGMREERLELLSMGASLIPQSNHGITVEDDDDDGLGYMSSSTEDYSSNYIDSSSSNLVDDAASFDKEGPLDEMSSLMVQLPLKRGLSKFYQGKSRSFACLSDVRSLEDIAKPERPLKKKKKKKKKKLKSSRSCGEDDLDSHRSFPPKGCSRDIAKKSLRGSVCSSMINARMHQSFLSSRPPIPPQRAGNISSHNFLIT